MCLFLSWQSPETESSTPAGCTQPGGSARPRKTDPASFLFHLALTRQSKLEAVVVFSFLGICQLGDKRPTLPGDWESPPTGSRETSGSHYLTKIDTFLS